MEKKHSDIRVMYLYSPEEHQEIIKWADEIGLYVFEGTREREYTSEYPYISWNGNSISGAGSLDLDFILCYTLEEFKSFFILGIVNNYSIF